MMPLKIGFWQEARFGAGGGSRCFQDSNLWVCETACSLLRFLSCGSGNGCQTRLPDAGLPEQQKAHVGRSNIPVFQAFKWSCSRVYDYDNRLENNISCTSVDHILCSGRMRRYPELPLIFDTKCRSSPTPLSRAKSRRCTRC